MRQRFDLRLELSTFWSSAYKRRCVCQHRRDVSGSAVVSELLCVSLLLGRCKRLCGVYADDCTTVWLIVLIVWLFVWLILLIVWLLTV